MPQLPVLVSAVYVDDIGHEVVSFITVYLDTFTDPRRGVLIHAVGTVIGIS